MSVLEVRALEKRYGRVRAVRGVTFEVERGRIHGFLGPNGSGKTTTLACALGLLRPTSGEVRVLGVPSSRIHETRGRVASVFDASTLVPSLSVRANLTYARRLLGHRGGRGVADVLELVGLADLAGRRASGLSLGQARRLSIARALLGKPELVVLDEPLSGLDTVGVLDVLDLFRRLSAEGTTLVVSSHRMHEMERVVTHVGVILGGELVAEGTLADLLGGDGRLRVRAAPAGRAGEVLTRAEGVRSVEASPDGALRVEVERGREPALVRSLVDAGVDVLEVARERRTLQGVFEELVRARRREGDAA